MDTSAIARAAALLRGAHHAVAITGAGISTPSGIPDFRSEVGLWGHTEEREIATFSGFQRYPERFLHWFRPLLERLLVARPNPAHHALAELERYGVLRAVITQNIDGLHQRAGSREVFELHGHMRTATCISCGHQVPGSAVIERACRGALLRCACGGVFKPDVVLFDEVLPQALYWLARAALDRADLLIVAGTSLEVFPVAELPQGPLRRGVPLIIVNRAPTYLDDAATLVIREDVATVLPLIREQVVAGPGAEHPAPLRAATIGTPEAHQR